MSRQSLLIVAPRGYQRLAELLGRPGTDIAWVERPKARGGSSDPYGVADIAARAGRRADAILLVSPAKSSPASVVPGPVIAGRTIGVVVSRRLEDLLPWLDGLRRSPPPHSCVVLSMRHRSYAALAARFAGWLRGGGSRNVKELMATLVDRELALEGVGARCAVAVYVGHGRSTGLTGYLGVRWHHVEASTHSAACGAFLCFACDTLKRNGPTLPFGLRWIVSGRANAYLGSVCAVSVAANRRFCELVGERIATPGRLTLAGLVADAWRAAEQRGGDALLGASSYRVVGHPLQRIR